MTKVSNKYTSEGEFDVNQVFKIIKLKKGMFFLDAGCGQGYYSKLASKFVGNSGKVFAVDRETELINKLSKEIKNNFISNILTIKADLTQTTSLNNNSIDITIIINVFHGLYARNELNNFMKEIFRITKTAGVIAIIEFRKTAPVEFPRLNIRKSSNEMEDLIKSIGFTLKNDYILNENYFLALFCK